MVIKTGLLTFALVFFLGCIVSVRAEVIVTDDSSIWGIFKGGEYISNDVPANARKPKEIFSDPDVLALAEAATQGDIKKINELVTRGVNVNARGWNNLTPIFSAMRAENKNGIEALLKAGANPNDINNPYGHAAIHQAAKESTRLDILQLILEHGGDPNLPETHGFCLLPLSMTFFGSNDIALAKKKIQLLLRAGADINRVNTECDLTRTAVKPRTILMASIPKYDMTYYLLELGADFNKAAPNGLTFKQSLESSKNMLASEERKKWRIKVLLWLENKEIQ